MSLARCRVGDDPVSVTTISPHEVPPRSAGLRRSALDAIWAAAERLYMSGMHPAIQVCVRYRGAVVLDRAIGHARGNAPTDPEDTPKVLATPETPFNVFSASKAITAMVVHLLDQRHLVHLDDPVCEYIPEFAEHDKHWITLRHVLTHRAGIPNLPPEVMNLDLLRDPDAIVQLLCEAYPSSRAGRQLAYHAITGGFVLGEVVRQVTGKDIRRVLDQTVRRPLKFRWMNYGVAPRDVPRVALNAFTGRPPGRLLSPLLLRALGVPFTDVAEMTNDPRFLTAIVPAGNLVATANELTRFYQLLLNGGELDGVRIFEPRTVRRATSEQSYQEFDFTLGLPIRYGMGFMLGARRWSLYGPDTDHAFGHLGFMNILAWADPERHVAAAFLTTGKPLLYPELYHAWDIGRQIGLACPRETFRGVGAVASRPEPARSRRA